MACVIRPPAIGDRYTGTGRTLRHQRHRAVHRSAGKAARVPPRASTALHEAAPAWRLRSL